MPPSARNLAEIASIPSTLGKYEMVKRLAVGGMAEIHLARAVGIRGFAKYVVLKCMHRRYVSQPTFIDMFYDEARVAARLHHRNIVQIHDFGCEDGVYFIAMEYLHGGDVQAILRTASERAQPVPLHHALTIVANVATGLHYAHTQRDAAGELLAIVHRDVAPSNVMVTCDGAVKLLDFGIARARINTHETDAGLVRGKLSYMSPEQCRGQPIDGRTDLFSLGVVLYELTTMTRLFGGERRDRLEIMRAIVSGRIPPPSQRVPGYPPALEQIVMRLLEVDRERRYPSGEALACDLERFARDVGIGLSTGELGRYVSELLGHPPEPWREDVEGHPTVRYSDTQSDAQPDEHSDEHSDRESTAGPRPAAPGAPDDEVVPLFDLPPTAQPAPLPSPADARHPSPDARDAHPATARVSLPAPGRPRRGHGLSRRGLLIGVAVGSALLVFALAYALSGGDPGGDAGPPEASAEDTDEALSFEPDDVSPGEDDAAGAGDEAAARRARAKRNRKARARRRRAREARAASRREAAARSASDEGAEQPDAPDVPEPDDDDADDPDDDADDPDETRPRPRRDREWQLNDPLPPSLRD